MSNATKLFFSLASFFLLREEVNIFETNDVRASRVKNEALQGGD